MTKSTEPGFELSFDEDSQSRRYPQGYWYAVTNDGNYDAAASSPIDALAALVKVLHRALLEKDE